jgi:hypothetical protein
MMGERNDLPISAAQGASAAATATPDSPAARQVSLPGGGQAAACLPLPGAGEP